MENKIESITTLNIVCFIFYGLSNILDDVKLFYIGLVGVLISFVLTVWVCFKLRRFSSKEERTALTRGIHSLVFCLFFFVLAYFKLFVA